MKRKALRSCAAVLVSAAVAVSAAPALPAMLTYAADESTATEQEIMEGVYAALIAEDSDFSKLKEFSDGYADYEASIESDELGEYTITIAYTPNADYAEAYGEESSSAYFTYDDGYIQCTASETDMLTAIMAAYMLSAVSDYYSMDDALTTGYINAVDASTEDIDNVDSAYYSRHLDTDGSKLYNIKFYAGSAWDESVMNEVLDSVYYNDTVIKNLGVEELSEFDSISSYTHVGKFYTYCEGNKDEITLTLAERGEYDTLGYNSITNLINTLKPYGYDEFNFSGEPGESKGIWSVNRIDKADAPEVFSEIGDDYELIQVKFSTENGIGTDTSVWEAGSEEEIMTGIYAALIAEGSDFNKMREEFSEYADVSASIECVDEDGSYLITIAMTPKPDYVELYAGDDTAAYFTYDNGTGRLYCEAGTDGWWTAQMLTYMIEAVSDYYGMNGDLVAGYINAVDANSENRQSIDSIYYSREVDSNEISGVYVYVGSAWDEELMFSEVLDWVIYDNTVIENLDIEELRADASVSGVSHIGKYYALYYGDKSELTLTLAEYGGYDESGYKSIKNLISTLKPYGYEDFDFSGELGESKGVWSVYEVTGEDIPEAFASNEIGDGYTFVQVKFESPYIANGSKVSLKAGETDYVVVANGYVVDWTSSNKKVATVNGDGYVEALKKGTTVITATLEDGKQLSYTVKVKSNPTLKVGGKKFTSSKTYTIKKGKSLTVKVKGKASGAKNSYSSSKKKVAAVTSSKNADNIKIKGLKTGTAKIGITVNGVKFKIKVKVVS